jgi:hypothetical protein
LLLDVLTFAIPNEQRPDGEAVPEVVHAWPGTIAGAPEPDLSGQAPEDAMRILRVPADREHQFQSIVNTRSSRW